IDLLTNGFDTTDIPEGFSVGEKKAGSLHLVYTGIIDSIRNPMPLLKAMREEFSIGNEDVQFTFVGRVSDDVREQVVLDSWLSAHVNFVGYVSHGEVFDYYAKADALALILTNTKNAKGNIPGKLFEYMATTLPILALGDPEGDSAIILEKSGAGKVLDHSDRVAIQISLRKLFERSRELESPTGIEQYYRKNLSFQLAKLLDEDSLS